MARPTLQELVKIARLASWEAVREAMRHCTLSREAENGIRDMIENVLIRGAETGHVTIEGGDDEELVDLSELGKEPRVQYRARTPDGKVLGSWTTDEQGTHRRDSNV